MAKKRVCTRCMDFYGEIPGCPNCHENEVHKLKAELKALQADLLNEKSKSRSAYAKLNAKLTLELMNLKTDNSLNLSKIEFLKIRRDRKQGDVIFAVSDFQTFAHRTILAKRSPLFQKLLQSERPLIKLDGLLSGPVLEAVVDFCYSGEIVFSELVPALEVLKAAYTFQLGFLSELTEAELCRELVVDNVPQMLKLARLYSAVRLQEEAGRLFKENFDILNSRVCEVMGGPDHSSQSVKTSERSDSAARESKLQDSDTQSSAPIPSSDPDSEDDTSKHIVVPDPDFHDFDKNRTEKDIFPGQVWAIYDDQDGMPRFYGRISRVSTKPFRAHINWLDPSAPSDSEYAWMESTGISIACGEFKIAGFTVMDQINVFSHLVMNKSVKGMLKIYPKKGEVWAVYRDWDARQKIGTARAARPNGDSPPTHDMVEIESDFSEEKSLKARVLLKVRGFKTLFRRQVSMRAVKYFKITELVKFSHCVPNREIDDVDADSYGIPRGTLELDPASTPLDLIMSPSRF